jgi:hypothetical protein
MLSFILTVIYYADRVFTWESSGEFRPGKY